MRHHNRRSNVARRPLGEARSDGEEVIRHVVRTLMAGLDDLAVSIEIFVALLNWRQD